MSRAKYPNRDALRKAHDIYLDAMYPFVSKCLNKVQGTTAEALIRDALRLAPQDDIGEKIEISDIAHLVRTYWYDFFEEQFEAIDPHYEARSAIGLIVEGRNRAAHRPWDLDPEFTRTHLFLIADALEKTNRPSEKCEVEDIQDALFSDDTAEQLATTSKQLKKAKTENTKYRKSLVEAEEHLGTAEAEKDDYKERLKTTSKELKDAKKEWQTCVERLETASKELADTKAEWQTCQNNLKATSDRLEEAVGEWVTCVERLTAIRNLFATATIGNREVQTIFPPFETDSAVRILDRRNVDKQNYLLELLEQKQPTLIYVQSEDMVELLLERVVPEKADVIGKCNERTSEAEETEILEKLKNGGLIAVVSNTAFSTLAPSHCVEHFVFCHLVPGLDEFFRQCELAFTSEKNAYLHLIYNSEQDIEGLAQKYPDREALEKLYPELKKLAGTNGDFIRPENVYNELDIAKPGIETGLAIFEELQLLERNDEGIKLLPPAGKKLDASEIYRRGEQLKNGTADFQVFQFEQSIEQIWEGLLKELNVDNEQILDESSVYKVRAFQDAITDSGTQSEQSTEAVENDSKADDEVSEAQSERPTEIVEDDNTVDGEDAEAKQPPKSTRKSSEPKKSAADKVREAKSLDERKEIGRQVAELRINSAGSKPSWRSIRTKLGLKNDEFHKVIRLEDHFHESVVERIESFEDGWQYDGQLEVLLGFEPVGELLKRIEACKPTSKVEAKKEGEPQVEESKDKVP